MSRPVRLSVILRDPPPIADGTRVTVKLGSGRVFEGVARRLFDGSVRVELPAGAF